MPFHQTASRLWKSLLLAERQLAATAFANDPSPELVASALGAVVKARRMRPQAARSLSPEAQARILATVLDPGENLAQGLLVSLHIAERRELLGAFLDALELPHEGGILAEEAEDMPPPSVDAVRKALGALGAFSPEEVRTYVNTLWLQDPERWAALPEAASEQD